MRVLSLFSGIGLLDLGLAWAGMQTVGLCEIEPYCRWVLGQHWPGVPIWSDVREVTGDAVRERCGAVDLVAGGFPCQPHSVAGARKGREDERHLWPEYARIVREVRPRWVLAENVPGLRTTAADEVLSDLDAEGYSCWPLVVGADDVGAPHRRKRVWIVGHASRGSSGRSRYADGLPIARVGSTGAGEALGDPTGPGLARQRADAGEPQEPEHRHAGDPTLLRGWPARLGEQQREWEAPRLAYGTSGEVRSTRLARSSTDSRQPESGLGAPVAWWSRWLASRRNLSILEVLNARGRKRRAWEDVLELWNRLSPEEVSECVGGCLSLPAQEVLLPYLLRAASLQGQSRSRKGDAPQQSKEVARPNMRSLRDDEPAPCPPCGSGLHEQRSEEHSDTLQAMSRLLAQHARADWKKYRRAYALAVSGNRRAQLQALGNGVVPQVVAEVGRAILAAEASLA